MQGSAEHRFVCPTCGETVTVDAPVRTAILDQGCVICGESVSESDFTRL